MDTTPQCDLLWHAAVNARLAEMSELEEFACQRKWVLTPAEAGGGVTRADLRALQESAGLSNSQVWVRSILPGRDQARQLTPLQLSDYRVANDAWGHEELLVYTQPLAFAVVRLVEICLNMGPADVVDALCGESWSVAERHFEEYITVLDFHAETQAYARSCLELAHRCRATASK